MSTNGWLHLHNDIPEHGFWKEKEIDDFVSSLLHYPEEFTDEAARVTTFLFSMPFGEICSVQFKTEYGIETARVVRVTEN
jgi:hypothetical protein